MQYHNPFTLTIGNQYWYIVEMVSKRTKKSSYSVRSFIHTPATPPPIPCWDSEEEAVEIKKLK